MIFSVLFVINFHPGSMEKNFSSEKFFLALRRRYFSTVIAQSGHVSAQKAQPMQSA